MPPASHLHASQSDLLMLPILRFLADGKHRLPTEIRAQVAESSPEVSAMKAAATLKNSVAWCLVYFQAARLVRKYPAGTYQIEDRGKLLLDQKPAKVTLATLRQYPEMLQYLSDRGERAAKTRFEGKPLKKHSPETADSFENQASLTRTTQNPTLTPLHRTRGCLLGGAVGDALGAPVELMKIADIEERFGPAGIRDFAPVYGRLGAITDDTQMTLFTAEGLLRAAARYVDRGICNPIAVLHRAYLRWLKTQGENPTSSDLEEIQVDGWLTTLPALWSQRGPGNTCLSALRAAKQLGRPAANNSKGCGGVMRVAPVGLAATDAFGFGVESAALTHGHPSGYWSAGFMALLIQQIVAGNSLEASVRRCQERLSRERDSQEVMQAVQRAEALAASKDPTKPLKVLGEGWIAEEALAISIYCALVASTFEEAVILAVNHSGDSDSTGAITGNICGALYGVNSIPARWLDKLELRSEITLIADDLAALRENTLDWDSLMGERYPPW